MESKIDIVYTIDMDYMVYRDRAQVWDGFEVYDRFLDLTSQTDKINYLYTGDELELCGLHFRILSAYEAFMPSVTKDLANDGSMMMQVKNKEETMLFCSDVGISQADRLLLKYGEELKCDYIQMGHHGSGGLSEAFYRMAAPRKAFFDAPEWLMEPEGNPDGPAPQKRRLMEEIGAEICYYATAPNRIELK